MRGEASYRVGARGPGSQLGRVTEPCRVGCGGDGGDGEGWGRGRERPEADGRPQGQRRSVGTVPQDGARHRPSARDALALANTELTQTHPLSEGRREATASRGQRDHVPTPAAQEEGATRTRPKATGEGICQPEIVTVRPLGSRRVSALRPSSLRTANTGGTAARPGRFQSRRGGVSARDSAIPGGHQAGALQGCRGEPGWPADMELAGAGGCRPGRGPHARGRPRGTRSRGSRRGPAGRARVAQAGRLHGTTRRPEAGPGPGPGSAGAERWWRSAPRGVGAGRGVVSKVAVLVCARPRDGHGTGVREASRPEQGE